MDSLTGVEYIATLNKDAYSKVTALSGICYVYTYVPILASECVFRISLSLLRKSPNINGPNCFKKSPTIECERPTTRPTKRYASTIVALSKSPIDYPANMHSWSRREVPKSCTHLSNGSESFVNHRVERALRTSHGRPIKHTYFSRNKNQPQITTQIASTTNINKRITHLKLMMCSLMYSMYIL